MSIKEFIFNYRLRKLPARQVQFPNYAHVRSVLVVYESDEQENNTVVQAIRDELLKQGKDVVLWGYCDKKVITTPTLPQSRILGKADVQFFGGLQPAAIADLDQRTYGLLLDLTQRPCLPLQYVAAWAKASFKAGLQLRKDNQSDGIHDFLIQTAPQESPYFLYTQIIKYLQMIHA